MNDANTPTPNPDHDPSRDEFFARLSAADPVDPNTLPSADAPAATQLLDQILATPAGEPSRPGAPIVTSAPGSGSVVASGPASWGRRLVSQGRGTLVAVAAAVMVLVGAVAVLAPDNTPAALAEVHSAAATTADADSGRIVTSFSVDYADDEVSDQAGGQIEVIYDGGDLGISVQLDDVPDELAADAEVDALLPTLDDIRLVDDVAYIQEGDQWIGIDTGGLVGDLIVDYVDPRTVLDTIQDLTETTEVGSADVDGVATTQYRSVIDLGDDTLAQSGWLAFDGMNAEVDGEITVDLYIDEAGALHRFDLTGDLQPTDGTDGSADFEVVTTFADLDADISIEAPEGAEIFDPLADGFGDGGFGDDGFGDDEEDEDE